MKDKNSLLIVDDDIAHRTMLRILFVFDWEYEIIEADDGVTALDKIQERSFVILAGYARMHTMWYNACRSPKQAFE